MNSNEPARARWVAHLRCGHDAHLQGEPKTGGYITCIDGRCQSQRRITGVSPVRRTGGVPELGDAGVQEPLWGAAA